MSKTEDLNLHASKLQSDADSILRERKAFDAFDELLGAIKWYQTTCESTPGLEQVAPFAARVCSEIESAIQNLRNGFQGLVGDLMRTVMEGEYLVDEFAADSSSMSKYFATPENERWKQYSPALLRKRRAQRAGKPRHEMKDDTEYGCHCKGVHFGGSTHWTSPRGIVDSITDPEFTIAIGEILEHGRRFLIAIHSLCDAQNAKTMPTSEMSNRLQVFSQVLEHVYFTIEVWNNLQGQNQDDRLNQIFSGNQLNMVELLRFGFAKKRADEIRSELKANEPAT